MKAYTNNTLGIQTTIQVPESADEYDKKAGRVGACVEDATQYNILHSYNTKLRSEFLDALEKETGVKRNVDQARTDAQPAKKDGTKTPVYEKESLYFKRVCSETGKTAAEFKDLAQKTADALPFDNTESTGGGGRIGKEYKTAAADLIAKGAETLAKVIANLERLNPGLTVELDDDGQPTEESLAKAIKVNADRKRAAEMAELAE